MTSWLRKIIGTIVALAGALWAGFGSASDAALMVPIGYSQNLQYFAFEEFGIQHGSGFAYSNIFMIDLAEDRWVVGTPIRVVAESEEEILNAVRARARQEAERHLVDLAIDVPAQLLAANADGEPDTDGKSLTFALPAVHGPGFQKERYELRLEQYPTKSGAPCQDWFAEDAVGFILTLAESAPPREVHRDSTLPRSRGCPADYRIHSVYAPFQSVGIARTLALISVYARGYEGLDRHFIGVALAKSRVGD